MTTATKARKTAPQRPKWTMPAGEQIDLPLDAAHRIKASLRVSREERLWHIAYDVDGPTFGRSCPGRADAGHATKAEAIAAGCAQIIDALESARSHGPTKAVETGIRAAITDVHGFAHRALGLPKPPATLDDLGGPLCQKCDWPANGTETKGEGRKAKGEKPATPPHLVGELSGALANANGVTADTIASRSGKAQYLAPGDRVVFVAAGIGSRSKYGTFSRRPSGGLRRFKSSELPMRRKPSEAQDDLDAYAARHNWPRVPFSTSHVPRSTALAPAAAASPPSSADELVPMRKSRPTPHAPRPTSSRAVIDVPSQPAGRLVTAERKELARCEKAIQRFGESLLEFAEALRTIRDKHLWRDSHDTFTGYLRDKWRIDAKEASDKIQALESYEATAKVQKKLGVELRNEGQLRALAGLEPDDKCEVLKRAAANAKRAGEDLVARHIAQAKRQYETPAEDLQRERERRDEAARERRAKGEERGASGRGMLARGPGFSGDPTEFARALLGHEPAQNRTSDNGAASEIVPMSENDANFWKSMIQHESERRPLPPAEMPDNERQAWDDALEELVKITTSVAQYYRKWGCCERLARFCLHLADLCLITGTQEFPRGVAPLRKAR